MLADPFYADLVHTIGVASLAADEKQIWHLTKVYWFTVEFGVVRKGDEIKAFGAGGLKQSWALTLCCFHCWWQFGYLRLQGPFGA